MKTKKTHLEKTLLIAMRDSGLTPYEIARRIGIASGPLYLFTSGKRSLRLATAGKVCDILGLELKPKTKEGEK